MKTLLKNGTVVNVFTDSLEQADVLLDGDKIIGLDHYDASDADIVMDMTGKYICPGLIDSHIHIESTMLLPEELARLVLVHGTTTMITDPHEIANVCGSIGIGYMLEASEGLPVTMYVALPSCVPATRFDESGAILDANSLKPFYAHPRVIALGEVMDYPGVIADDPGLLAKIRDAKLNRRTVNGHAPLLSGKALDQYLANGIDDDHECSNAEEAKERIRKGQTVMVRQGTAARNLKDLLPLFEEPWSRGCVLATDDKHPADLLGEGHIDQIVRTAKEWNAPLLTAIRMATVQAARHFGLMHTGAVAPGYDADLLVLDNLDGMKVRHVFKAGRHVVRDGEIIEFRKPDIHADLWKSVLNSFFVDPLTEESFRIEPKSENCRVIKILPGQLLTEEWIAPIRWDVNNGVDSERDILKLAVVERHMHTGHIGLGFISGLGLKRGAIASSISHDSHNLIVAGTNEADMALAANEIRRCSGGCVVVADGKVLSLLELPVAGLMSMVSGRETAEKNEHLRRTVHEQLGVAEGVEPFMNLNFVSLPVIPNLKMTTKGLVDVIRQQPVSLYAD